jgi:pimeloyl-ACP methyl ester carboxylesterase
MTLRRISVNGIELSVRDEGAGPPVVLCHGFPELAYSWRHQVPVLVEAGYRVLVPDMRGYGQSSVPGAEGAYDLLTICDDMLGLLDAVGERSAVFVGHDWGATIVWQLAAMHPERVDAVAGLGLPFTPRTPEPPVGLLRRQLGDGFYIPWFQERGVADQAFDHDVRRALLSPEDWGAGWHDAPARLGAPPSWMTETSLEVYVDAFTKNGFTGPLSWYRNLDRNWRLTEPFADRRIEQPALFVTGELDRLRTFLPATAMDGWVTDLRGEIVVPGAGHRVQQEAPEAVNEALLGFLSHL